MKSSAIVGYVLMAALVIGSTAPASARRTETIHAVQVKTGWNLLSLPASVSNGNKDFLFPSSISPAYVFSNQTGYVARDSLNNGIGFWLKFAADDTLFIQGDSTFQDTIEVQAGWNLIGSLTVPVLADSIQSAPQGIISTQFFGFVPGAGHQPVDTLSPGRGYWVKVSQNGTLRLREAQGLPCPGIPTVTYAGKTYNTVQIGTQCWLRENLDVGIMIQSSQNQTDNGTIEKYCYGNNPSNCDTYGGGFYQWDEVMQYDTTAGMQGICPTGWHVPTLAELQTLSATVGDDGNALKGIGWGFGSGAGTNTSGFSAKLVGYRYNGGYFSQYGSDAFFWGSTRPFATYAYEMNLYNNNAAVGLASLPVEHYGFSVRCIKDDETNLPPDAPSNPIPDSGGVNVWTSPTLRWSCSDPENDPLTYDVYFGTDNPPVTLVSSNQSDTNLTRTGLISGTTYYWKVVAKDNHGNLTDGPVWSYTSQNGGGSPCPGTPTVTYAGKTYNTVQIGSQCWLKENLNVGSMVLGSQNQTNNGTIEKYCYSNSTANCNTYGGLYQWNEAMQYIATPGVQGICPPGWHLPTLAEFQTLDNTVGGSGNALKAIGQGSGPGAGTNTSGFSALLAGQRDYDGPFYDLGYYGFFWSSTQEEASLARRPALSGQDATFDLFGSNSENYGYSVRCIKN